MLSRCLTTFAKVYIPNAQKSFMRLPVYRFSSYSENSKKISIHEDFSPVSPQPIEYTAIQQIQSNPGLSSFMNRVYKTSGIGILGAISVSYLSIAYGLPYTNAILCSFGGFIAALIGIFGTLRTQPTSYFEYINGEAHLKTKNSVFRIGLFGLGMAGLGLSSSVLFGSLNLINSDIVPLGIVIAGIVFGSASLYALYKPKSALFGFRSSLFVGLSGLIELQMAGFLAEFSLGPNNFSFICHGTEAFFGVGLFTTLVAYDTEIAIQQYEKGNADHLAASITFILDFWNLLNRISQILGTFTGS